MVWSISCAAIQNLVIISHRLHCFQSWAPGRITCIATLPWIALLAISVSIELVSSSARVTSVKFAQGLSLTQSLTSGPKDPKHTWKILKNAQKPFPLPYLISLKVPAFSQYCQKHMDHKL